MIQQLITFFIENFPNGKTILIAGPIGLTWAAICLAFAGYMKKYKGWRTGYSRKTFHFLIFFTVAFIHWRWGTSAMCLFGGMTSLVVLSAIIFGPGNFLYEAMAREKDEPYRTRYIVYPYFATFIGGVIANVLFGKIAIIGYLVTGLADAIAEPVGTRFGKHLYHPPSFGPVKAVRSWEGSAAVLLMSFVAISLGMLLLSQWQWHLLPLITMLSIICALTEAVSPHGWDNMTMQIIPTFLSAWIL